MGGDGQWAISSSYKRYIVSANHQHHQTYPTSRNNDSAGLTSWSGPSVPQTVKRDRPRIVLVFLPLVSVIEVDDYSNYASSISLYLCPLTNYSCHKNRSSGHNDLTSVHGGKVSDRIHFKTVTQVLSSSCKAVIRNNSPA